MKIGARPENALEWIAQKLELAPTPIADTHIALTAARAIMAGTSLGIFDAIARGARTADEIASACRTDTRATRSLLDCLVSLGYVRSTSGSRYANTKRVQTWLLTESPRSVRDKLLFEDVEWNLLAQLEDFVRTGKGKDLHASLDEAGWRLYQNAMRALAANTAPAIARRLPVPRGAKRLLDVGGSHGLHSIALCRRHPELRAEILELPDALRTSSSVLEEEGLGERVRYRAGDALRDDLGSSAFDVVLVFNLVHHFSSEQNESLVRRIAQALRPGGISVIGDMERKTGERDGDVIGATMGLYFALTSTSGTWPLATMRSWQRAAGLVPLPVRRVLEMPGFVLQIGRKPKRPRE